jgi:hypothetical protein
MNMGNVLHVLRENVRSRSIFPSSPDLVTTLITTKTLSGPGRSIYGLLVGVIIVRRYYDEQTIFESEKSDLNLVYDFAFCCRALATVRRSVSDAR